MIGMMPLKRCANINLRDLPEDTDPEFEFHYIDISAVGRGALVQEPQRMRYRDAPSRARRLASSGDTIVSTVRTYLRSVLHIGSAEGLVLSTGFAVISPKRGVDPRYLTRVIESDPFIEEVVARSVGVSYPAIAPAQLGDIPVPMPNRASQKAIADFLDLEIAKIDEAASRLRALEGLATERLIAQLEALASQAAITSGWRGVRNKTFMKEIVDLSVTGDEELLTVSHLTGVTPRSQKDVYMFMAESLSGYKRCQPGDLVINTMWAWMGAAGVARQAGIVSPAYGVYRLDRTQVDPTFIDFMVRSRSYVAKMGQWSEGVWTSRLRLYPDALLAIRSWLPPLSAQQTIASEAARLTDHAGQLVSKVNALIGVLQERRQALITGTVTGQIPVLV